MRNSQNFDFTETTYRSLLSTAKKHWRFVSYQEYDVEDRAILWRHDVDVSVHRAYRLAEIETEEGVSSTFFLMLHSPFYNLLEFPVSKLANLIAKMGHRIGLHFDPSYYGEEINSEEILNQKIENEKSMLEDVVCASVQSLSWHNPTLGNWLSMSENSYAGLVNAYGSKLNQAYRYISDSNGYWRHDHLVEVLENFESEKIQVLTHPEWWQKQPMSPREKVYKCAYGRAASVINEYDSLLETNNRENISDFNHHLRFLKKAASEIYQRYDYLSSNNFFDSLLVELYRLHHIQIRYLCLRLVQLSCPEHIVKFRQFSESVDGNFNGIELFDSVFGRSWFEVSGSSPSEHEFWLVESKKVFEIGSSSSSELSREGSIYFCKAIESVVNWGREQGLLTFNGIGLSSDLENQSAEDARKANFDDWKACRIRLNALLKEK